MQTAQAAIHVFHIDREEGSQGFWCPYEFFFKKIFKSGSVNFPQEWTLQLSIVDSLQ